METFYVKSRYGNKVWRIYYHKPKGQFGYVAASEGESSDGIFITVLHKDRYFNVTVRGRATKRNIWLALSELLVQMAASSAIDVDEAHRLTSLYFVP